MAKVTFIITDTQDAEGRIGTEVEAFSDNTEDRGSIANIVAFYLAEEWDTVVAAARGRALSAMARALAEEQAPRLNGHAAPGVTLVS